MNTSSNAVRGAETATEQLQLELERLRSELDRCATRLQLTEKLLEHVADAVFVADLDGRIIDVNQQFTNADSTALDVTEGTRIEEASRRSEISSMSRQTRSISSILTSP